MAETAIAIKGGTKIEWADVTFNPWWGCAEVSPGCGHCYARTWAAFTKAKLGLWPQHGQAEAEHGFMVTGADYWKRPLRWARELPEQLGRRPRVFCASMADVFEDHPSLDEHRVRLYDLILRTPELDWLVLTKRPEVAQAWLADGSNRRRIAGAYAHHFEDGDAAWDFAQAEIAHGPQNVWMGVSIENARFTWRADVLREIPAAVRFISAEPLLGSLFDGRVALTAAPEVERGLASDPGLEARPSKRQPLDLTDIDWVIIGGESGPGARPFHLEHAREIISARAARVWRSPPSLFVKQLGAKPIGKTFGMEAVGSAAVAMRWQDVPLKLADRKGGDMSEWPADLRIREFPRSAVPA